jgi:hypothetical protein
VEEILEAPDHSGSLALVGQRGIRMYTKRQPGFITALE